MLLKYVKTINRVAYNHLLPACFWLYVVTANFGQIKSFYINKEWLNFARETGDTIFILLFVVLFLIRKPVIGKRARPFEAIIAIAGTQGPILFNFLPVTVPSLIPAGLIVGSLGLIWSIVSISALGKCFGVFPEVRGLITHGPYRLVRHPVYLGEILVALALMLPTLSITSFAAWFISTGLQLWRSANEERALTIVFPEYEAYKATTRRIIPFV